MQTLVLAIFGLSPTFINFSEDHLLHKLVEMSACGCQRTLMLSSG